MAMTAKELAIKIMGDPDYRAAISEIAARFVRERDAVWVESLSNRYGRVVAKEIEREVLTWHE